MYWHIGKMKTASTFLQRNVFDKHSELEFLGWKTKISKEAWSDPIFENLVRSIRNDSEFFLSSSDPWWKLSATLPEKSLISDEGIGTDLGNWSRNLKRIKYVDPSARLIWFIRSQPSYLLSQYYQYQRGVFGNKNWRHISLSRYFFSKGKELAEDCFYAKQLQEAEKIFGSENLLVIPYEWMGTETSKVACALAGFLSISASETLALLETSARAHVRPVRSKIEQSIESYFLRREKMSGPLSVVPGVRRYIYQGYDEGDVIKEVERLGIDFRSDNAVLDDKLRYGLQSFGYPL